VRDGETGTLMGPDPAPEALAAVMLSYLRDPERVKREGARGREAVVEAFDARHHARKIHAQIVAAAALRRR
jgi:glycosyltransferase involved in cell wall biosynthesis